MITLNDGQRAAKEIIDSGQNCFITGSGGKGKSALINVITDKNTILAAPTGAAALQIGGQTCSSLFGLPIGVCLESDRRKPPKKFEDMMAQNNYFIKRIVIDEFSMVRADQLTTIDHKLRMVTRRDVPFGGIQIVLVGDLFQLAPVLTKNEAPTFYKMFDSPWAFKTQSYRGGNFHVAELTQQMRQGDAKQGRLLESIRTGDKFVTHAVDRLNEISRKRPSANAIYLCGYNRDVEMINGSRYSEVEGKEYTFTAENNGFQKRDMVVDEHLTLKVGAKVLIKFNCPNGTYVNGTQGYIVDFHDQGEEPYIVVETNAGDVVYVTKANWEKYEYVVGLNGVERKKVASFKQYPIKLGWAISIHGSQGATLDEANIDFGFNTFAPGQAYVALSRVRDLTKIYLQQKLEYSHIKVDEDVKKFYESGGTIFA